MQKRSKEEFRWEDANSGQRSQLGPVRQSIACVAEQLGPAKLPPYSAYVVLLEVSPDSRGSSVFPSIVRINGGAGVYVRKEKGPCGDDDDICFLPLICPSSPSDLYGLLHNTRRTFEP